MLPNDLDNPEEKSEKGQPMTSSLEKIDAYADKDHVNVVVETPKGSRTKYAYDPESGLFALKKVLPDGMVFPYNFGFIPSTIGEDGDPLDVLLWMEQPVAPGCLVEARLLGVLKAEQKEDKQTERNDRLIAVPDLTELQRDLRSIKELESQELDEIEHFFVSYHLLEGTRFKVLGRGGPGKARDLVQEGLKGFARKQKDKRSAKRN